jgi:hypothetical protein
LTLLIAVTYTSHDTEFESITGHLFAATDQHNTKIQPNLHFCATHLEEFFMPRYTFAELLNVFFYLHQGVAQCKTQGELAVALKVSQRTVAGWFAGDYTPRTPALVEQIAHLLCLTSLQADLLLPGVCASRHGTGALSGNRCTRAPNGVAAKAPTSD